MANYESLKSAIRQVIKPNGNEEITGQVLQDTLISLVSSVGQNATFAGVAVPTTNPQSPDGNVFYLATQNGTYSNFGGIVVADEVAILSNASGTWAKISTDIANATAVSGIVYTNNVQVNTFIKELFFDNADLSDIVRVRIIKFANEFGMQFVTASNVKYNYTLVGVTAENKICKYVNRGGTGGTNNACYALINWDAVNFTDKSFYGLSFTANAFSIDANPSIKSFINVEPYINAVKTIIYTDNDEINSLAFIKELYFENCNLDGITGVRFLASPTSNERGLQIYEQGGVRYNFTAFVPPDYKVYKMTNRGGTGSNASFAYVLIDWDKMPFTDKSFQGISFTNNALSIGANPSITAILSIADKDYEVNTPNFIFGIESGSLNGREYFTTIYPEALLKNTLPITINGVNKALIQRLKYASTYPNIYTETKSITMSGKGYADKIVTFDYVRANRKNAQNKVINILCIGDSITEQDTFMVGQGGGNYVNYMKQFADMDDEDIHNIKLLALGTRNAQTHSNKYNDKVISTSTKSEGRSGWATYGYLNWPKWVRFDGRAYESTSEFIGVEAMYYSLGLATKTPYDSTTAGQTYVAYSGTAAQKAEIVSTPLGRFKPDCNEALFKAMKNYADFRQAHPENYQGATSDSAVVAYWANAMSNPDNVFYSVDKARAYSGAHVWTNTNAFSLEKWLERYRTLDDTGVRLQGSAGQQVVGSDGKTYTIGTKVTNVNDYDVCTPTHIISALGTNDGGVDDTSLMQMEMLNELKAFSDSVNVGYFLPRRPGVINPQMWQEYGLLKTISDFPWEKERAIRERIGLLDISRRVNYIPAYFTASPISSGYSDRAAYDLDDLEPKIKIVSGIDNIHPSAYWHRAVGYQCLAWVYWTLQ